MLSQELAWRWLANSAVGAMIVLALGGLAVRCCRQPVRRSRVVVLTLLGALIAPAIMAVPDAPRWSAGLIPAMTPARAEDGAKQSEVATRPEGRAIATGALPDIGSTSDAGLALANRSRGEFVGFGTGARDADAPGVPSPTAVFRPGYLPIAYLAVSVGMLAWWLFGQLLLWRVSRAARPARGSVRERFLAISGPAGGRVRLLESDRIALPFTYTWTRPVILLPASLCGGDDDHALRYCLAHEWSHVERRDALAWSLAALAGMFLYYQPLFWWLRRQLRLCQDHLADDRAAAIGSTEDYAAYLVRLARYRRSGLPLPALGVGDRRSNLYRRVVMLVQDRGPLEHRCRTAWSLAAGLIAALVIAGVSGLRLEAAPRTEQAVANGADGKVADKAPAGRATNLEQGRTYVGQVTDKDTGKPIAGASVFVRLYVLDKHLSERIMGETRQKTDSEGRYRFTIAPEQLAEPSLCIYLEAEHPGYFFYYNTNRYGAIVKNEKLGGRPFFENLALRRGKAIEGRLVNPEGTPVAGVRIDAFCTNPELKRKDPNEWGAFTWTATDAEGRFRLDLFPSGPSVYWICPKDYALSTHVLKNDKRGDLGTIILEKGNTIQGKAFDAQGNPVAGAEVRADRDRTKELAEVEDLSFAADHISRTVVTGEDGTFTIPAMPAGVYEINLAEKGWDPATRKDVQDIPRRPLSGVFTGQKLTVKDGEPSELVVIRAVPHVVVEARVHDSKGARAKGNEAYIVGRIDNKYWSAHVQPDEDGAYTILAPHGLEQTRIDFQVGEQTVLRLRTSNDGPLTDSDSLQVGTLDHDVKGIEIVRYVTPIVLVKVAAEDGTKIVDASVSAMYTAKKSERRRRILKGYVLSDCGFEVQEECRFRSRGLYPDEEFTVTAQAKGYTSKTSSPFTLTEGATREIELILEKSP